MPSTHKGKEGTEGRNVSPHIGSALCTKEGYESDFQSRDIKKLWFIYTAGYSATRLRLRRNVLAHRNSIAGVLPVEIKGYATPCDLTIRKREVPGYTWDPKCQRNTHALAKSRRATP